MLCEACTAMPYSCSRMKKTLGYRPQTTTNGRPLDPFKTPPTPSKFEGAPSPVGRNKQSLFKAKRVRVQPIYQLLKFSTYRSCDLPLTDPSYMFFHTRLHYNIKKRSLMIGGGFSFLKNDSICSDLWNSVV